MHLELVFGSGCVLWRALLQYFLGGISTTVYFIYRLGKAPKLCDCLMFLCLRPGSFDFFALAAVVIRIRGRTCAAQILVLQSTNRMASITMPRSLVLVSELTKFGMTCGLNAFSHVLKAQGADFACHVHIGLEAVCVCACACVCVSVCAMTSAAAAARALLDAAAAARRQPVNRATHVLLAAGPGWRCVFVATRSRGKIL